MIGTLAGCTAEESRLEERSQAEKFRIARAELDSIAVLTEVIRQEDFRQVCRRML